MTTLALIAVDWGITSFRAYALDAAGRVQDQVASNAGILSVANDGFEETFLREGSSLLQSASEAPVTASGMITSRQGWVETPYVAAPAGIDDLAAALVAWEFGHGHQIHFAPGMSLVDESGMPDVMRGEETQIIGAIGSSGSGLFVLPGTHSKWVLAEDGRITWFATFMTGELFAVLREYSILGRLMDEATDFDDTSFERGIDNARAAGPESGGLLKRLFSTRTLGLFDKLSPAESPDYLSGLLIGSEIVEALACISERAELKDITIIGGEALARRYRSALDAFGIAAQEAPADVTANGLFLIAAAAGLLEVSG